jgi:hypothetical protein
MESVSILYAAEVESQVLHTIASVMTTQAAAVPQ